MTAGRSARTSVEAIVLPDADQRDGQVARTSVEAIVLPDANQRDGQVARVAVEVILKLPPVIDAPRWGIPFA